MFSKKKRKEKKALRSITQHSSASSLTVGWNRLSPSLLTIHIPTLYVQYLLRGLLVHITQTTHSQKTYTWVDLWLLSLSG